MNYETCRYFAPFTGCANSPMNVPALGAQVVFLVFIGVGFAAVAVWGIVNGLGEVNHMPRWAGWLIALAGMSMTLTFYGWGAFGNPGDFWGLW